MNTSPQVSENSIQQTLESALGNRVILKNGWLSYSHPESTQGWKLHVSSTILSAVPILKHVLPLLLKMNVPFKVAASLGCLSDLNEGRGGLTQVGKFITIYPKNDAQAVQLAIELDQVTARFEGPSIPSDQTLHIKSNVSYRYGGFTNLEIIDSLGNVKPAIRDFDGNLVEDKRSLSFDSPQWVSDPFRAAGIVEDTLNPTSALFGDYLILSLINQNAKGGVYLALDPTVAPARTCVLKEGRQHLASDMFGRDIRDRVRHQYNLLKKLASDPAFPKAYNLFELDGNCYLVMEYIEGQTLQSLVTTRHKAGEQLSTQEMLSLGIAIASSISRLHQRGWILRDLTPTNIIVDADKQVHVVDLELLHSTEDHTPPYGWGTLGYTSPQQADRQPPTPLDDIFSFGATMYYIATNSDPSFIQGGVNEYQSALTLINSEISDDLTTFIASCMDPNPNGRPQDMLSIQSSLAAFAKAPVTLINLLTPVQKLKQSNNRHTRYLELAIGAGDMLLKTAESESNGLCWASTASTNEQEVGAFNLPRHRTYSPNLHNGVAGIGLFLTNLGNITGNNQYIDAAEKAGNWLLNHYNSKHNMLPGLHFGEAGIAAFLFRLAEVSQKTHFSENASKIAMTISPDCTDIPDLTHGWAGIGLVHLILSEFRNEHLNLACAAGDILVSKSEPIGSGFGWRHPPGVQIGMSDEILTGFAHGAAGIGYFLLELWHITKEDRYLNLALGTARWLGSIAETCLADGSGCNWPLSYEQQNKGEKPDRWFFWCHGVTGIGLFFLRAWELIGDPEYKRLAVASANTVAIAGRCGGGALCHGLPGNGSMLLEAYQVLQDSTWLNKACDFGNLLELYAHFKEEGIVWPAEHSSVVTPDYMVGYSGTGDFFLRLAMPDNPRNMLRVPVI